MEIFQVRNVSVTEGPGLLLCLRLVQGSWLGGNRRFWTTHWRARRGHQSGLYFDGQMTADLWLRDLQWILTICTKTAQHIEKVVIFILSSADTVKTLPQNKSGSLKNTKFCTVVSDMQNVARDVISRKNHSATVYLDEVQ